MLASVFWHFELLFEMKILCLGDYGGLAGLQETNSLQSTSNIASTVIICVCLGLFVCECVCVYVCVCCVSRHICLCVFDSKGACVYDLVLSQHTKRVSRCVRAHVCVCLCLSRARVCG